VRHNLGRGDTLVLWGESRFALPAWFTSRFPARYVHAHLLTWPDAGLAARSLSTPPGLPDGLCVVVPERAVLELLYEAGVKQSLEEARNLFDGLRSPRKELLGNCCLAATASRLCDCSPPGHGKPVQMPCWPSTPCVPAVPVAG
jgi:hypothetical protein